MTNTCNFEKQYEICEHQYDVIVVGGGSAGICAAVASARQGADTLLIENTGWLGGIGSTCAMVEFGPIKRCGFRVLGGIPYELMQRMKGIGGTLTLEESEGMFFAPDTFAHAAMRMCLEAGVTLMLHSHFVDVITSKTANGRRIDGILVSDKSRPTVYTAKVYVDCTGDGDVFARADLPWALGRESDGLMQPMTLVYFAANVNYTKYLEARGESMVEYFKLLFEKAKKEGRLNVPITRPGSVGPVPRYGMEYDPDCCEVFINSTNVLGKSGISSTDMTEAEIITREQIYELFDFFKSNVPGFEKSYLSHVPARIGVRETRRLTGAYTVTRDDLLSGRKFEDTVAIGFNMMDVHQVSGNDFDLTQIPDGCYYSIPYRTLYSNALDNLLVAGRCISADHEALGAVRVMVNTMPTGEAAGCAAALAAAAGVSVDALDTDLLRSRLADSGVILGKKKENA